jgi:nicotinamide phosphoribosyltransferase
MITAQDKYARLCTYLETLLTMVWYGSSVATISRYTKDVIKEGFAQSVDDELNPIINSRLHDFGFRGCTSVEQAIIGGSAHLLSFGGSDNMAACYHAQYNLNNQMPVANSIPATEHSVMTAWCSEKEALDKQVEVFGQSVFSVVMDSYDYDNALDTILPTVCDDIKKKGGFIVIRPDSGDPVDQVIKGLKAAEKCFESSINSKGYKVLHGAAVLQGDGIDYATIIKIQEKVLENGFSATCVAYGMGGNLLQKVNRDTMSFATKLCYIETHDGQSRDVMKTPKSGTGKTSLPGQLFVGREAPGKPIMVYDKNEEICQDLESAMRLVYDCGPVPGAFDDINTIRARLEREWSIVPPRGNPISKGLAGKIRQILLERGHVAK